MPPPLTVFPFNGGGINGDYAVLAIQPAPFIESGVICNGAIRDINSPVIYVDTTTRIGAIGGDVRILTVTTGITEP